MQYAACKFRSTDARSFTYHYEGDEPLAPGDFVKVPDRSGDGWKRVQVVSVSDAAPSFPTKGIIGIFNLDAEPRAAEPLAEVAPASDPLDDDEILF